MYEEYSMVIVKRKEITTPKKRLNVSAYIWRVKGVIHSWMYSTPVPGINHNKILQEIPEHRNATLLLLEVTIVSTEPIKGTTTLTSSIQPPPTKVTTFTMSSGLRIVSAYSVR